jgi:pilus assembly protein Flp/PilA
LLSNANEIAGFVVDVFRRVYIWFVARYRGDDRGASLVEYALLVALIAVVCIVAVQFVGSAASTKFSAVGSNLS